MNAAARCLRSLPDGMTRAFCWRWRGMGRPTLVPFFLRFLRLACAWGPSILQRCSSWPPSCPSIWWFLSSICSDWRLLVRCRALLDLSRPEVHCLRARRLLLGFGFFSSSGLMASAPYSNLNGVNLVVLVSDVLWDQTTFGSSSTHLPFFWSKSYFLMPVKMTPLVRSTAPLDWGW